MFGWERKELEQELLRVYFIILGTNLDYYNPYIVCRTMTEYMFCPILESVSS